MQKLKKRGGFTLVELIVVLVILAILAALLIPALTGYIDKAKKDQVVAETRMLHEAVQTVASEAYGSAEWEKMSDIYQIFTIASKSGRQVTNAGAGGETYSTYIDHYNEVVTVCFIIPDAVYSALITVIKVNTKFTTNKRILIITTNISRAISIRLSVLHCKTTKAIPMIHGCLR